jgi:hypothetical protein
LGERREVKAVASIANEDPEKLKRESAGAALRDFPLTPHALLLAPSADSAPGTGFGRKRMSNARQTLPGLDGRYVRVDEALSAASVCNIQEGRP